MTKQTRRNSERAQQLRGTGERSIPTIDFFDVPICFNNGIVSSRLAKFRVVTRLQDKYPQQDKNLTPSNCKSGTSDEKQNICNVTPFR